MLGSPPPRLIGSLKGLWIHSAFRRGSGGQDSYPAFCHCVSLPHRGIYLLNSAWEAP